MLENALNKLKIHYREFPVKSAGSRIYLCESDSGVKFNIRYDGKEVCIKKFIPLPQHTKECQHSISANSDALLGLLYVAEDKLFSFYAKQTLEPSGVDTDMMHLLTVFLCVFGELQKSNSLINSGTI